MAWDLIKDEVRPEWGTYDGPAEVATWVFVSPFPEQIPGVEQISMWLINGHISELEKQGSTLLRIKVWEDWSKTWQTDFLVQVTATASPIYWTPIILAVIALAIIVVSYFDIREIRKIMLEGGKEVAEAAKELFKWIKWVSIGAAGLGAGYLVTRAIERKKQWSQA